jgi:hypothetical protein
VHGKLVFVCQLRSPLGVDFPACGRGQVGDVLWRQEVREGGREGGREGRREGGKERGREGEREREGPISIILEGGMPPQSGSVPSAFRACAPPTGRWCHRPPSRPPSPPPSPPASYRHPLHVVELEGVGGPVEVEADEKEGG